MEEMSMKEWSEYIKERKAYLENEVLGFLLTKIKEFESDTGLKITWVDVDFYKEEDEKRSDLPVKVDFTVKL